MTDTGTGWFDYETYYANEAKTLQSSIEEPQRELRRAQAWPDEPEEEPDSWGLEGWIFE